MPLESKAFGPFTAGINRLTDRTSLSPNEVYDCHGISVERGRLHHCWERDLSAYSLTGNSSFPVADKPTDMDYWPSFGTELYGLLSSAPTTRLLNYIPEGATAYAAGKDPYTARAGLLANGEADTIVYRGVLFVFEEGKITRAYLPLKQDSLVRMKDGISTNTTDTSNTQFNVALGTDATLGLAPDDSLLDASYQGLSGFPLYLSNLYVEYSPYDKPNATVWRVNSSNLTGSAAPVGPDSYFGFQGGSYGGAPFNYQGFDEVADAGGEYSFLYFSQSAFFDPNKMTLGSYFADTSGDALISTGNAAMHTETVPDNWNSIRVPVPGNWCFYSKPAIYKERLMAVNSAEFINQGLSSSYKSFSDLNGSPVSGAGEASGLEIQGNIVPVQDTYDMAITRPGAGDSLDTNYAQENFNVGDRIVVQETVYTDPELFVNSGNEAVLEFVGFKGSPRQSFVVKFVSGDRFDFSSSPAKFWTLTKNPSKNKSVVAFGKAAGTGALNSNSGGYNTANIFDWMIPDPISEVAFSVEEEGEIVTIVGLEDRLIVFLDNAIRFISGDLPLGGVVPPNYQTGSISRRVGLSSKRAYVVDDESQTIYFAAKDGLYRLYGDTVERIDEKIRYDSDHYNLPFTRVFKQDKWVYFVNEDATDESNYPSIWILDLTTETWWRDSRVGITCDNTQKGAIMSPYDDSSGVKELLFVASDNAIKTYNDLDETPSYPGENTTAAHKCFLQTGFTNFVGAGTGWPRRVVVKTSKNDPNAGTSVSCDFRIIGEGISDITRRKSPLNRNTKDVLKYRASTNSRSDGAESLSVLVFDPSASDSDDIPGSIDYILLDEIPSERSV